MNPASPHTLYRYWAGDVLLYVGISVNAYARAAQHRESSAWWPEADRMTMQQYPDRAAVLAAELNAIRTESPKYNIAGREKAKPERGRLVHDTGRQKLSSGLWVDSTWNAHQRQVGEALTSEYRIGPTIVHRLAARAGIEGYSPYHEAAIVLSCCRVVNTYFPHEGRRDAALDIARAAEHRYEHDDWDDMGYGEFSVAGGVLAEAFSRGLSEADDDLQQCDHHHSTGEVWQWWHTDAAKPVMLPPGAQCSVLDVQRVPWGRDFTPMALMSMLP